jgi:NAD(P)-dependent dehydrogenase (short-subunit alcohol dehydrogenase family)
VRARAFKANVSDQEEVRRMVEDLKAELGPITILVNNAGITRDRSFLKMTRAMWDEVLGVNLNGPFNTTQAVLPGMIEAGWGRIINITSVVGLTGNFGQANYATTKGGLISFTMTLAREVARKGVTVNAVAPGFITTDMTKDVPAGGAGVGQSHDPGGPPGHNPRKWPMPWPSWPARAPASSPGKCSPSTAACICDLLEIGVVNAVRSSKPPDGIPRRPTASR